MYNFKLVNADTDSITVCKQDGSPFSDEENKDLLLELNSLFPKEISWEPDGQFESVVVLKAKNYILWDGKKKKIKGSALRGSAREKALAEFIGKFSDLLLEQRFDDLVALYDTYTKEITNIKDITRWSSKKTVTEKVLNPERTNEQKVLDALAGTEYSVGDKRYFYFSTLNKSLKLQDQWCNDHDIDVLLKKLHNTVKIFDSVIDLSQFPNYSLKKNRKLLNG